MKVKSGVVLLLAAAMSAGFFSCKNGLTIFEQINQETELEEPVITGTVNSIVKFNSKLYASDGNIYSKDENTVRGWRKSSKPADTIIKLAADSTNLYALTEEKKLYKSSDGSSWSEETCKPTSGKGIETIFCNGKDTAYLEDTGGKIEKICSGGSSTATASDIPTTVVVVCSTDDKTYYAADGTVRGKNGSDLGSVSGLGTVHSLTYSSVDSALYAGTSKGLKKLPVGKGDGKLTGEALDPPGNWGGTLRGYQTFAVLATGSSSSDAALYASTIESGSDYAKVNGLWGYYYNRRDTWNRE